VLEPPLTSIPAKGFSASVSKTRPLTKRKRSGRPPIPAPEIEALDSESDEPIERQIYLALRRSLMSGAILPGSRISSRSIASSLGVSAMPVREALKRLESDGAMKSSAKSCFVINFPTVEEFAEILQIRLRLEIMLAREATPRLSDAEIEQISWLQERMAQSKSWRQVLSYNYKMHFQIYRAASMPFALSLVENIWVKIGPTLHVVYDEKTGATPFDHHYTIIEGLRERDPEKVEQAIRSDLKDAATVIKQRLSSGFRAVKLA
jgi:DNA-binding GntR family transcriptional regulator